MIVLTILYSLYCTPTVLTILYSYCTHYKVIASASMIVGLLVVALPITVLGGAFAHEVQKHGTHTHLPHPPTLSPPHPSSSPHLHPPHSQPLTSNLIQHSQPLTSNLIQHSPPGAKARGTPRSDPAEAEGALQGVHPGAAGKWAPTVLTILYSYSTHYTVLILYSYSTHYTVLILYSYSTHYTVLILYSYSTHYTALLLYSLHCTPTVLLLYSLHCTHTVLTTRRSAAGMI
jgi:hypothetical protein